MSAGVGVKGVGGGRRKKKKKKKEKSHLGESTTFIMQYVHFLFHLEIMRHVSG